MSSTMTETAPAPPIVGSVPVSVGAGDVDLAAYDEEQVRMMEERCILVDENDVAYGEGSKKRCHLMANISTGLLHRAFSVFLFRPSDGRLLLQKRADEKITFPSMWTNTCCSHPLSIRAELAEENQDGVRAAAIRKLEQEMGIPRDKMRKEDFTYLKRIHYLAPSDGLWGEHEIDYIMFTCLDVPIDLNPNEASDCRYVSPAELEAMFADSANAFTPWFRLIARDLLLPWWTEMLDKSKAAGWDEAKGQGKVDAGVLKAGTQDEPIVRML